MNQSSLSSNDKQSVTDRVKGLKNKKIPKQWIAVIIVIAVLGVGGMGYWLYDRNTQKDEDSESSVELDSADLAGLHKGVDCSQYSDDSGAMLAAINGSDLTICECVEDQTIKEKCVSQTKEILYQVEAVSQCDPTKCNEISNVTIKDSCFQEVTKYVESLDEQQRIACAFGGGNFAESIKDFEAILAEDPNNIEALLGIAMAYANQALIEHRETELIPKAEEFANKAEQIVPTEPAVFRTKGFINEIKPDREAALSDYSKAIELDADFLLAYLGRGHVYEMNGDYIKAVEDYKKAETLDTNNEYLLIYSRLCKLAGQPGIGDTELAINSCNVVVDSDSANALELVQALSALSAFSSILGRESEAAAYLEQAEAINPNDVSLMVYISDYNTFQGNYDKGIEYGNRAIQLDSMRTKAYLSMARSYNGKGDVDTAVANALKAEEVIENDPSLLDFSKTLTTREIYNLLIELYGKKGDEGSKAKYENLITS